VLCRVLRFPAPARLVILSRAFSRSPLAAREIMDADEYDQWGALRRAAGAIDQLLWAWLAFQAALRCGALPDPAPDELQAEWRQFCRRQATAERLRKAYLRLFSYWLEHLAAHAGEMSPAEKELWAEWQAGAKARAELLLHYGEDFISRRSETSRKSEDGGGAQAACVPTAAGPCLTREAARRWAARIWWVKEDVLMAAAKVGLVHAVDRFDHTRRKEFPAYARPVIDTSIQTAPEVTDSLPRDVRLAIKKVSEATRKLGVSRSDISVDAIAKETGLPAKKVQEALDANAIIHPAGEFTESGDEGEETSNIEVWDQFQFVESAEDLSHAVEDALTNGGLHEHERLSITLYYWDGLDDREICRYLGLQEGSLPRVRVLRWRGLRKAKAYLEARGLVPTWALPPLFKWSCVMCLEGDDRGAAGIITVFLQSLRCLTMEERLAVEGHWLGQSASEIAKMEGVAEAEIEHARRSALSKLEGWFLDQKGGLPGPWSKLAGEHWISLLDASFPHRSLPPHPKPSAQEVEGLTAAEKEALQKWEEISAWNRERPSRILILFTEAMGSLPREHRGLLEEYWEGMLTDDAANVGGVAERQSILKLGEARKKLSQWMIERLANKNRC